MKRARTMIATMLLAVLCLGSKCNLGPELPDRDPEIAVMREILLLNDAVINSVDDMTADGYDGSDEAFEKLGRTVCILETWQLANEAAWKAVRVYELAKHDLERKSAGGEISDEEQDELDKRGDLVMAAIAEAARFALVGFSIYAEWGQDPPESIQNLIELAGKFLGHDLHEPPEVKCSEVIGAVFWPQSVAA